jgi:hypothetical protein
MKTLIAFAWIMGCAFVSACSADSSSAPESGAQDMTSASGAITSFRDEMRAAAKRVASGDCFTVGSDAKGLTLTVKDGAKSAQIVVAPTADIEGATQSNGSVKIFMIAGVGEVITTSAEDQFEEVTVSSTSPPASATCRVEF